MAIMTLKDWFAWLSHAIEKSGERYKGNEMLWMWNSSLFDNSQTAACSALSNGSTSVETTQPDW